MIFDNILIYFVIVPVLTLGGLALCQNKGIKAIRTVAVTGASVLMALALYLVYYFLQQRGAGNNAEMLLTQSWTWYAPLNIKLALGVDGVSVAMILLSAFIVFAGVFASWKMDPLPRQFFMWFFLLSTGVFGFFISIDLFTMFMFYEVALIPMYLLIGVWGSGNKNYSAMKLTLMLMGGSAFLMLSILGIYFHSSTNPGALTMNLLEVAHNNAIPHNWQLFLFPMAFVGFGVLGAMFPFHTWSPDGHASAPTAVSMLHAGVLMKLGGYGCFRIAIFLMPYAAAQLGWIFLTLTGISIVYGAFSACVQTDLKYINAYSSVSHCGMVLFALIGMIYGRTHTRDIRDMGGMMHIMPYLGVGYIIAGLASLGLPGLSGFVAEMTIFFGSWLNSDIFRRVFTVIATTSIVITAVYILRVVGKLLFGPVQNEAHRKLTDATWFERLSTVTLMVAVAAIGCFPNFFVNIISNSFLPVVNALKDYFPVVMQ